MLTSFNHSNLMGVTANSKQREAQELTAGHAISHLFSIDSDHIEKLDDYLVELHTFYLTNERSLSKSCSQDCNFYFNQMHRLLKNLIRLERQASADEVLSSKNGNST